MINCYQCLSCYSINQVNLFYGNKKEGERHIHLKCSNCNSLRIQRVNMNDILTTPLDRLLMASNEALVMVAKHDLENKLEEISLISGGLVINLVDIYLDTSRLIAGLALLDNHNYSYVEKSRKLLEKNNEKLFELKENIQEIRKLSGK